MANWSSFVLTDVGAKLQAKINAGLTTLKFTKLGIGSGSGSGSVNALTAMVNKVQDINIGSVKANNNIVTINSTLTNKGLGSAYQMRELGLFATDPDMGEILFAYMTDSTPDTMPADGSATVVSQDITLNITFSNTGKVSATIDTGAFVTHEDLNTHNTSSSAHADIRAQITSDINAHNSDTSAHTPITDQIKAILGDTNWQENPVLNLKDIKNLLGQGAIVASKLDANAGFVKFANGFTIQWGLTWFLNQNTYCDVTLPIRCNVLVALCTDDSASTTTKGDEFYVSWNSGFSNNNRTSIRFLTNRGNAGNFTWLCLGIS